MLQYFRDTTDSKKTPKVGH